MTSAFPDDAFDSNFLSLLSLAWSLIPYFYFYSILFFLAGALSKLYSCCLRSRFKTNNFGISSGSNREQLRSPRTYAHLLNRFPSILIFLKQQPSGGFFLGFFLCLFFFLFFSERCHTLAFVLWILKPIARHITSFFTSVGSLTQVCRFRWLDCVFN